MLGHVSQGIVLRLVSTVMILSICSISGDMRVILGVAAILLLTEIIVRICHDILPERDEDISLPLMLAVWLCSNITTFGYLSPAIILADQPSVPLMLTGFIWIFGVFVHISNTFIALPVYNWSQMIPGAAATASALWVAVWQGFPSGAPYEWVVTAGVLAVYFSNTLQTLITHKETQRALNAARADADARLAALEHMTQHDSLTGLLNRRAFDERLHILLQNRKAGSELAVYLIDLDGFKPINDSYSHETGDRVLIGMAERLARLAGTKGLAARLGGDEFAIAMPAMHNARLAMAFGKDIATEIDAPILHMGRSLRIGASIGIGMTGQVKGTVAALTDAADQAMYRAKTDPGNKVALFDPQTFRPRITLQDRAALIEAMNRGEIVPHYQPKVSLASGGLLGFEALARWEHPGKGLLLPGHFLPKIDELGLQGDFLNHIARQVLRDISALLDEGLDPGKVSINVPEVTLATYSGRQDLDRLLATFPEAIPHITFEITEDVFIARAGNFIQESISHFRAKGLRISLDDFGTGFASFQHLRELEFDELKIDTSFVAGLGMDKSAEVLVGGFLTIANGLGVDVIAEGVETDDQRTRLLALGATMGQGWRFGRAVPLADARVRIAAEQTRATG